MFQILLSANEWMECDDMKKAQCDWSPQEPQFDMNQAHIVMWEKWSGMLTFDVTREIHILLKLVFVCRTRIIF